MMTTKTNRPDGCKAPASIESTLDSVRRSLDRDDPTWLRWPWRCAWCRADHILVRATSQTSMLPGANRQAHHSRPLPPMPKTAGPDFCRWHRTALPQLAAPCAYCGAELHIHRDPKTSRTVPAREGQAWIVHNCPACHRPNALYLLANKRSIRAEKMAEGLPVRQIPLASMR